MIHNYGTLGLPITATKEQVKAAYRRLAMEFHPDRLGGNEEKFKQVKAAYEAIENAGFTEPKQTRNERWRQRESQQWQNCHFQSMSEEEAESVVAVVVKPPIVDAFHGFIATVAIDGTTTSVSIPAGVPDGARLKYTASNGKPIWVQVRIVAGAFSIRGLRNTDNNLFSAGLNIGDIELRVEIDAIDLITGAWIKVEDFLGERLDVRVPAGFNPLHRLKIAGKGYCGWIEAEQRPSSRRADMYLKLAPVFNRPENIPREKIVNLFRTIENGNENEG